MKIKDLLSQIYVGNITDLDRILHLIVCTVNESLPNIISNVNIVRWAATIPPYTYRWDAIIQLVKSSKDNPFKYYFKQYLDSDDNDNAKTPDAFILMILRKYEELNVPKWFIDFYGFEENKNEN